MKFIYHSVKLSCKITQNIFISANTLGSAPYNDNVYRYDEYRVSNCNLCYPFSIFEIFSFICVPSALSSLFLSCVKKSSTEKSFTSTFPFDLSRCRKHIKFCTKHFVSFPIYDLCALIVKTNFNCLENGPIEHLILK